MTLSFLSFWGSIDCAMAMAAVNGFTDGIKHAGSKRENILRRLHNFVTS